MATTTKHTSENRVEIRAFLEKIVIDAGLGRASQQPNFEDKILVQVQRDLAAMTGQKPQTRAASKSIAGFKIREGQIVGVKITLRRARMVDFFERLIRIVLPRVRDFRGLEITNVDKGGVLNVGIKEHAVFSEILPEHSPHVFSLGISIVPKKKDQAAALEMYRHLGVPLKKEGAPSGKSASGKSKKAKK